MRKNPIKILDEKLENGFSDVKSIYLVAKTTYLAILAKLELIIRNEDWISPQISEGTPWNGFIMNSD